VSKPFLLPLPFTGFPAASLVFCSSKELFGGFGGLRLGGFGAGGRGGV